MTDMLDVERLLRRAAVLRIRLVRLLASAVALHPAA